MTGGAATTALTGTAIAPVFIPNAGATIGTEYGLTIGSNHNSTVTPANLDGVSAYVQLSASSTGGTITAATTFIAPSPIFNASATTNITNFRQFYAADIVAGAGNTITNSYGYFHTIQPGTGKWGFFGNGGANNAYAGNSRFGGITAPVATVDVTGSIAATTTYGFGTKILMSNTAPTIASGFGGTTPTISCNGTATCLVTTNGTTGSQGVLTMPSATTGWNCTSPLQWVTLQLNEWREVSSTQTSVTFQDITISTGAALTTISGQVIMINCVAY
jgi:hypothetical protein